LNDGSPLSTTIREERNMRKVRWGVDRIVRSSFPAQGCKTRMRHDNEIRTSRNCSTKSDHILVVMARERINRWSITLKDYNNASKRLSSHNVPERHPTQRPRVRVLNRQVPTNSVEASLNNDAVGSRDMMTATSIRRLRGRYRRATDSRLLKFELSPRD